MQTQVEILRLASSASAWPIFTGSPTFTPEMLPPHSSHGSHSPTFISPRCHPLSSTWFCLPSTWGLLPPPPCLTCTQSEMDALLFWESGIVSHYLQQGHHHPAHYIPKHHGCFPCSIYTGCKLGFISGTLIHVCVPHQTVG